MGVWRWFGLCLWIVLAYGQTLNFNDLSGEDIVAVMSTQPNCPPTTSDGMNWAPLPKDNAKCGSAPRCDFPNQWCAFKLKADQTPDMATLTCKPLSDGCKQAFQQLAGGATGGTSAPGATTGAPTPGQATGGQTTAVTTGPPTPGLGGATTAVTTGPPTPGQMTSASGMPMGNTDTTQGMTLPQVTDTTNNGGLIGGGTTPPTPGMGGGPSSMTPMTQPPPPGAPGNGGEGGGLPPPGACCDYHEYCCFWAATGECDRNKSFMGPICQKSCGLCNCNGNPSCQSKVDPSCSSPNTPPGTTCPCTKGHLVNKDWNPKCSMWAAKGECDKNTSYMKAICKVSCNVCM